MHANFVTLSEFLSEPLAIVPERFAALLQALARPAAGTLLDTEAAAGRPAGRSAGAVAVVPLAGVISPRGGGFWDMMGGTSAERFAASMRQAAHDPAVGAIVIDVDSPGGSVAGIPETAGAVRDAAAVKPVVAVANSLAASAAYWIASNATELMVTPSGEVGSVGVFAAHEDISAALEQAGVKVSLITAGKYKTEGNPYAPLTEEGRAAIQDRVNEYYGMFVRDVARGRGVSTDAVKAGFGEGRTVGAKGAVAQGMADAVGTLDEAIRRAAQLAGRATRTPAAELDFRQRRARAAQG